MIGLMRKNNSHEFPLSSCLLNTSAHHTHVSEKTLSVTQLLRRIKNVIEIDVGEVWVEGEVSNLKKQGSGHWYFTLKDDNAQIQCAMFGARKRQGYESLEDGAKVRCFAEATVYEARGSLQIIVLRAEAAGLGELQARFEALKKKLLAEGLFEQSEKRKMPTFPRKIGIVTSETGAVIQDILNILARRAPWAQPYLIPVRVQGRGAEREIAAAVKQFSLADDTHTPRCDVLIVGRGGGSLEDLWCFNEEIVARAIASCSIPVISAVGHEVDFTIADFVADLRAPTPSAAAEIAVPDAAELISRLIIVQRRMKQSIATKMAQFQWRIDAMRRGALQRNGERLLREPTMRVDGLRERLQKTLQLRLAEIEQRLELVKLSHRAQHPLLLLQRRAEGIEALRKRMHLTVTQQLSAREKQLRHLENILRTLGPESSLQRGYSITFDEKGNVLRSHNDVKSGAKLITRLADGEIASKVE